MASVFHMGPALLLPFCLSPSETLLPPCTVRCETGATASTLPVTLKAHRQERLEYIRNSPGISIFLYQSRYHDPLSLNTVPCFVTVLATQRN